MEIAGDQLQLGVGQLLRRTSRHIHVAYGVVLAAEAISAGVQDVIKGLAPDVLVHDPPGRIAAMTIRAIAIEQTLSSRRIRPVAEPSEQLLQLLVADLLERELRHLLWETNTGSPRADHISCVTGDWVLNWVSRARALALLAMTDGALRGENLHAGLATTAVLRAADTVFLGAADAVSAHRVAIVVACYVASGRATPIVVAAGVDSWKTARRVAVGRRPRQRVCRAAVPVVATRWAVAVAQLADVYVVVPAHGRAIVVVSGCASHRAAPVSVRTQVDCVVRASGGALTCAANQCVSGAGVPVIASGGTAPIARFIRIYDTVTAGGGTVVIVASIAPGGTAPIVAVATHDDRVIARGITVGGRSAEAVYGACISILASGWAVSVANFLDVDEVVAANCGAIAIVPRRASDGAASIPVTAASYVGMTARSITSAR